MDRPNAQSDVAVRPTVLVVDDDPSVQSFLGRLLGDQGYTVELASDGESALASFQETMPAVVLLDIGLPGVDGLDVCRRLRQNEATRLTPVILITGTETRSLRVAGLDAGADDFLTKPVDTAELLARVRSLIRIKHYTDDLDSAASIILTLATMIEARDGYGDGHCHRMANYATSLGRAMHLDDGDLQALYRGGFLHDIGMLAISDSVLQRAGPLNADEYDLVKSHPLVGDALCSNLRSLRPVRPIIRWHHERLDGTGYPDQLVGDQIPLTAQIVGLVDVYEAVTTQRPYQQSRSRDEAIELLRGDVERGWRRHDLVETFILLLHRDAENAALHLPK